MASDVLEDGEVVLELDKGSAPVVFVVGPRLFVGFALLLEGFAGLAQLVVLMDALDGLFETDGDQEAEDDSGDVDEEVAPGAGGVVGRVDVEHGGGFLNRGGGVGRGDRLLLRDGGSFGHGWRFGDKSNADRRWQEKKVRDERAEVADNGSGGCHLQDITLRA